MKGSALIILIFILAFPTFAVMLPVSDQYLAQTSEQIITGEVVSKEVQWVNNHTRIYTFVTVRILTVLKGDLRVNGKIVLTVPGGFDPESDLGMGVSDQPEFQEGECAYLYLNLARGMHDGVSYDIREFSKTRYPLTYRVNSHFQGKHAITQDNRSGILMVSKPNTGESIELKRYRAHMQQFLAGTGQEEK